MERAVDLIGYVNNALLVALAIHSFSQWRRRGGRPAAWIAVMWSVLGAVAIIGLFTPDDPETSTEVWVAKLSVIGILVFPYALYRFTTAFRAQPRWLDTFALALTLLVGVVTLALPDLPGRNEPRPGWYMAFVALFLLQWSVLLFVVGVSLWRSGRGQPTLVRRRMRLLSVASVAMAVALLVAGAAAGGGTRPGVSLATGLIVLGSIVLFAFGFAPPSTIRIAWRHPEQVALYAAAEQLVSATTEREVAEGLLPHVARIVGARAAALDDPVGRRIGLHGAVPDAADPAESEVIEVDMPLASLIVWTSPYTPFFGREEVDLLRSLAVMANLALERAALFASEQESRRAAVEAKSRLEALNDELRASEARLAEAQALTHVGSFEWMVQEDRFIWSDEMFRIFGRDRETFVPTYEVNLAAIHPDDRDRVTRELGAALEIGDDYQLSYRLLRPDGSVRFLHARGSVDRDGAGEVVRSYGTLQDVTELRVAERALAVALESERDARLAVEKLNKETEEFLYTVSHDLNGPLISLIGFMDFLTADHGDALPEQGRFYLQRMDASARHMQALIKDLLDLSRIGRVQADAQDVELAKILGEVTDELQQRFPELAVETGPLPEVRINHVRARQLFTNLLANAAKYAGNDAVVTVSSCGTEEGLVCVSVRDNGPGIPPQMRGRAFGVFDRLDARDDEGTGMGLAICKKIIETNGGAIWIEDSPEGADVRFTIPLARRATSVGAEEQIGA